MIDFLSIVSFWGFVVCLIILIVRAIKKKPIKKVGIVIVVCFVVFGVCVIVSPTSEQLEVATEQIGQKEQNQTESSEQQEQTESIEQTETIASTEAKVEYDDLQKVFLGITTDTTEDEIKTLIKKYNLKFTTEEYNGTPKELKYRIAYEDNIALQKHADSGDALEVTFSKENGSLMVAEYFNEKSFMTAILYNYGVYWDFRADKPENDYTGYYCYKPGDSEGGITIEYDNGNSVETGYYNVSSARKALESILKKH